MHSLKAKATGNSWQSPRASIYASLSLSPTLSIFGVVQYAQSYLTLRLYGPTIARQAPLSMGFSRQEYWSGLPFPFPEDLPDPGIELVSPELQASSILLNHAGSLFLLFYISADFCCCCCYG